MVITMVVRKEIVVGKRFGTAEVEVTKAMPCSLLADCCPQGTSSVGR